MKPATKFKFYLADYLMSFEMFCKGAVENRVLPQLFDKLNIKLGKIVFTGLGKAGIAARKAAATFSSMGMPSVYLDPATALHGDLGVVTAEDVLVAITVSGKTREVLETLALAPKRTYKIAVTSHPTHAVAKHVNMCVSLGDIEEVGSLGLAPTVSFISIVAFLDTVAVILAEARGWSRADFGRVHHSGYLGKAARR